jgi:hypothetical protein
MRVYLHNMAQGMGSTQAVSSKLKVQCLICYRVASIPLILFVNTYWSKCLLYTKICTNKWCKFILK